MFSFAHHPLYERQLIEQVVELVDSMGAHPDRPIVIQDDDPDKILVLIDRNDSDRRMFLVTVKDKTEQRSVNYMIRHFPKLVYEYFERESVYDLSLFESYSIRTTISFMYNGELKRYYLLVNDNHYAQWTRQSTYMDFTMNRILLK